MKTENDGRKFLHAGARLSHVSGKEERKHQRNFSYTTIGYCLEFVYSSF